MVLSVGESKAADAIDVHSESEAILLYWNPSVRCAELPVHASSIHTFLERRGQLGLRPINGPIWGFTDNDVWCELKLRNATPDPLSLIHI